MTDDRDLAQRALHEERERWRTTLSSIADAVIGVDLRGGVAFMNAVGERLTGWTEAEARGVPLGEVFRTVDDLTRAPVESPSAGTLREGVPTALDAPTLLVARDGTERPIEALSSPIRDVGGATVGAVLVFRDATERRRAEEGAARLAAIVQSSDDAIVSKTLDGVIRSWNAGAERLYGWTEAEAVGRPITIVIPPELHAEERAILERLRRGERIEHFETERVAKDGHRLTVSLTVSPLHDAAGRVIGASKIARDVTAQKRLQAELEDRARALEEANRQKDEFVAMFAHELRNPLAPIRTGLDLLRLPGRDPTAAARVRDMMDRQLTHLVRLVDDLLDVSRMSRGILGLERRRVRLADVVRDAVEATRPLTTRHRQELTVRLPEEPVELDADPTRLTQALGNLLVNGSRYSEPGTRIRVEAGVVGQEVEIRVEDQGRGLSEDALATIFDRFARVDPTSGEGGLGLGLWIARGLVTLHGGTLTATSPGPGRGSTFTVRLPRAPTEVADDAPRTSAEPESNRRRVLVVDDNLDAAEALCAALDLLGHEVHVAHDGLQAIEVAERVRPDTILMDLGMPRLDGLAATRRIRGEPWGSAIRIIALTGWGQERDRDQTRDEGFDGHLVKPVSLDDIAAILEEGG